MKYNLKRIKIILMNRTIHYKVSNYTLNLLEFESFKVTKLFYFKYIYKKYNSFWIIKLYEIQLNYIKRILVRYKQ